MDVARWRVRYVIINNKSKFCIVLFLDFDPKILNRVRLPRYPKSSDNRSFHAKWYDDFDWLEYDPGKDAVFCYACRVFGTTETKESTYSKNGFRNWKNAMDKRNGLPSHNESQAHKVCMTKWNEQKVRSSQNVGVSSLLNEEVLAKRRYYISSIFDIIRFLVVNELPFRGSYNQEEHCETGLFQALFQYTLKKDKQLAEYTQIIPKHASYTSPQIQNEFIEIMAECVKNQITTDVNTADVPFYCVMADGTRDRKNIEAVCIVLRFIKNGVPVEALLSIEESEHLTADYLSDLILNTLMENNINSEDMLCQCYDGAAVMKGWKGGVRTLIEEKLNRTIPYVHCFNHQLHLIVIDLVKNISEVKQYFDYCHVIHKIFSTFKFKSYYDGHRTSRLLEQRWTGHLKVTTVVLNNYSEMIEALKSAIKNEDAEFDGAAIVECTGLLSVMKSQYFRFMLCTIHKFLRTIEPADKSLQSRESGLASSLPIINSVYSCIEDYRCDSAFEEVVQQCNDLSLEEEDEHSNLPETNKRRRTPNKRYSENFVLTEDSSGLYRTCNADVNFKQIFFEIIDLIIGEMKNRFINNDPLFNVIDKIYNFSFNNVTELKELQDINSKIKIPSQEEVVCVKRYFEQNNIEVKNYLKELFNQRAAFGDSYQLYAAAATFACSSATCEASFSVLSRILTAYRQSMLFGREANLSLLPFEKKRTEMIDCDTFLQAFNDKVRRLQLY